MREVLSIVVSLCALVSLVGCSDDTCVKVNGVCQDFVTISEESSISSVKTKCHNPTSLMVSNDRVYVVCSGDYVYDKNFNYQKQKDSGVEFYSSNLDFMGSLISDSDLDLGKITSSKQGTYVGSTQTGRYWVVEGDSVKEIGKKDGAVLPYCTDDSCLFLEQNTGKLEIVYNTGEIKSLDLSEKGVEFPWFVSPQIVGDHLYLLNSATGQFNKYSFDGKKIFSKNVGQQYPNDMIYHEGYFYILDSQNNTVDRVNENGDYTESYIDLGLNANPYAISVWKDHLIIACYSSGFVYGFDLTQSSLIQLNKEPINQPAAISYDSSSIFIVAAEYSQSGSEGSLYKFSW